MDYLALLGTGIIVLAALGLRSLRRRSQARLQLRLDERHAAGLAAGKAESSNLAYQRGKFEGLTEGYAQAERELTIRAEKAFERGYERGQLDLLATFEQADQVRGERPAMSA